MVNNKNIHKINFDTNAMTMLSPTVFNGRVASVSSQTWPY